MKEPRDASPTRRKAELRVEALRRRNELAARIGAAASAVIAETASPWIRPPENGPVAGYWPLSGELDPRPLMARLDGLGYRLALPRVVGRDRPLAFHAWSFGTPLIPGALGVMQPPAGMPTVRPAILLVPVVGFDGRGYRLGHGGGYYDRTLGALRADGGAAVVAIGLAFADQRIEALPVEPFDAPLDLVVTERGVIAPGEAS